MKISLLSFFCVIVIFVSCKKNENPTPDPVVTIKPDTLASGWRKISINPSEFISDIFFNNNTTGYLIGTNLYKSVDGGNTWNKILNTSGINIGVTNNGNIHFVSNTDTIFSSANSGSSFSPFKTNSIKGFDIYFVDNNNGFYLGNDGLYKTNNAGILWTKLTTSGVNFSSQYSSFCFTSPTAGFIVSSNGIFRTNGSILNWMPVSYNGGAPVGLEFQSIYSTPNGNVYASCRTGEVYKSVDGGVTFSFIKKFSETLGYSDIHFVDNNIGYVTVANRIYKTTDAGLNWTIVVALGESLGFVEIHFNDANHGWACIANGSILVYN